MADSTTNWLAGVDGCRAGWLVVLRAADDSQPPSARIVATFADILTLPEAPRVIAVDMPIGLPERAGIGGRPSDGLARAKLGARQSSLFALPARAAVMQDDYRMACTVALAHSDPPRKVSRQMFNLFPKIREIDRLMTPALQDRVFECHPEVAFWAMNGERSLDEPKKVKSRANEPGLALRRDLLAGAGFGRDFLATVPFRAKDAGADDLLDACACAWTAGRILTGTEHCFPAVPDRDARGLRQEIRA